MIEFKNIIKRLSLNYWQYETNKRKKLELLIKCFTTKKLRTRWTIE